MPAHPHVSFFPKFGLCPEIFSDMLILKLHYLKIQNLKIKQKFSRTVLIYGFWPFYHHQRCFKSPHSSYHPKKQLFYFWRQIWNFTDFQQKIAKISGHRLNFKKSETWGCADTILLLLPKNLSILTSKLMPLEFPP